MPCKQENVFYYLDGELSPAEAALVRKHIRSCAVCKALWSDLKPVLDVFDKMPAPPLEAYEALLVRHRVMAPKDAGEWRHEEHAGSRLSRARFSRHRSMASWPWVVVVLALVAAMVVGSFVAGVMVTQSKVKMPARERGAVEQFKSRAHMEC